MISSRQFFDSVRRVGPSLAVVAGTVWAICLPYEAAAQGGFNGPGRYEITNLQSGKVLDLDRNDQTSVIQFSSRGTDNQVWDITSAGSGFYYLRNTMNGNALEAVGTGNSTPVRGTRFNSRAGQQWRFDAGNDGNVLIISRLGKALDIPGGTSSDGARVQIYDVDGGSNQRFTFRRVSGGRGFDSAANVIPDSGTITCSSDNGRRVYCGADTRGGVRLVRQISGSRCAEGSTWGYDERGIWVDAGCRAEFDVSANGPRGRGFGSGANVIPNSGTITCSSDNGRRVYCGADTRGGVRLVRQISGSRCAEGSTWGYDQRGIWVDAGCRAEFDVSANGPRTLNASPYAQSGLIDSGTSIPVLTNEAINVRKSDGRVFTGVVYQDVTDVSGTVAIPRGSIAELIVTRVSNRDLALDLESITVSGRRYAVPAGASRLSSGQRDGIGTNQRTAVFAGGGALVGTIIGAFAGGGRGAAIGAGAGAGAGIGTQFLTRGRNVRIPAESVLTFRLDQPMAIAAADHGFTRNGRHYHQGNR